MKNKVKNVWLRLFFLFFLGIIFEISVSWSENYPSPKNDYINDFANVIDIQDENNIEKMFSDLEYSTGIEAVAVTVNSIQEYGTNDKTIESFSANLFNNWGIGHKKENNGVLILMNVKEREIRIELGKAYGEKYNKIMQDIIDGNLIYFKNGNYSRGLFEISRAVKEKITIKIPWYQFYMWHIIIGIFILIFVGAAISMFKKGKNGWGWTFLSMAGILLFFLLRLLSKGKSLGGFGGGSSGGGGATGRW